MARRIGRALPFILTSVSSAICIVRLWNDSEEVMNQGLSMRGLVRGTTLQMKFAHARCRSSGYYRPRPRSGRPGALDFDTMPKRQAADGEITEGVMATYEHGEQAAAVVAADLREGIQEMVTVNLMPSTV